VRYGYCLVGSKQGKDNWMDDGERNDERKKSRQNEGIKC
jgi:hypothetical protein